MREQFRSLAAFRSGTSPLVQQLARYFLAVVGLAYLGLAAWCVVLPEETAAAVGFTLVGGSGRSEYLVVYGGLQTALGLVFLRPLFRPADATTALRLCAVVHGCLVLFRTAGFLYLPEIGTTTYSLAATEWAILLAALALACRQPCRRPAEAAG